MNKNLGDVLLFHTLVSLNSITIVLIAASTIFFPTSASQLLADATASRFVAVP